MNRIKSKKELAFYIASDRIISGLPKKQSLLDKMMIFFGLKMGGTVEYLRLMRLTSYYKGEGSKNIIGKLIGKYYSFRFRKFGLKLGFSIGSNSFGYGLLIPHYGTIVINDDTYCGNYAVLHNSTCIGGSGKVIGDGLYLSSGAKIMGNVTLGDGVSIATNSVVNTSFDSNVLLAGMPAEIKKASYPIWFERDGEIFVNRVKIIENLRSQMFNNSVF